ncbi:MAG TPA: hypothetical protein VGB50_11790 [Flavobacterium sp.]|jgi:hypothetical protein
MAKTNNLPAFSIMEAVVGMAVTAIVMSLIFFIFSIMAERMLDYKNQNLVIADMNRLTYSINKDIFDSQEMGSIETGIIFHGYAGQVVRYRISDDQILRDNEVFIDTFRIRHSRVWIDSLKDMRGESIFQRLSLRAEINEEHMDLRFFKKVYADRLLNQIKLQ